MTAPIEYSGNGLNIYCSSYLLHAKFAADNKLMLEAKPSADLELVARELRNELNELVNLEQHLDIYLYKPGYNELIEISVN